MNRLRFSGAECDFMDRLLILSRPEYVFVDQFWICYTDYAHVDWLWLCGAKCGLMECLWFLTVNVISMN